MYIDDLGSAFGEEVAEFIRKQVNVYPKNLNLEMS